MAIRYNRATRRWENFGDDIETMGNIFNPNRGMTQPTAPTTTTTQPATTQTTPKTTAPKRPTGGMGGPTAQQVRAGRYVGGRGFKTEQQGLVDEALSGAFDTGDYTSLINALLATGGSGAGGWKANPAAAAAGFAAARQQEAAGRQASEAYNKLAATQLADSLRGIKERYGSQETALKDLYSGQLGTSQEAIRAATREFLGSMPTSTGFQSAQFMSLPQEQQALSQLAAYGATGERAKAASEQDAAMAQAIQNIMGTSARQLGQAEQGYLNALATAGRGAEASALQGLAQQASAAELSSLLGLGQRRAEEESAARAIQQQLLAQGIESLMSGRTAGATTRASTVAEYGRPKAKPKQKSKGKGKRS